MKDSQSPIIDGNALVDHFEGILKAAVAASVDFLG